MQSKRTSYLDRRAKHAHGVLLRSKKSKKVPKESSAEKVDPECKIKNVMIKEIFEKSQLPGTSVMKTTRIQEHGHVFGGLV